MPLTDKQRELLESPVPKPLSSADIAGVAKYIKDGKAKNIIVMTGAGISSSAGIPDFRTPGTGLYYNLQKYHLDRPEDVFDIDFFHINPMPFFEVAKGMYPGLYRPTKTHYFIRLLADHGLLVRQYTQNIDTLEQVAGMPKDKVVFAHGSFATAHCVGCHKEYSSDYVREQIFKDEPVKCECGSYIKPDIVFFGESLPREFFDLQDEDFAKCDLLIVMGTSLVVRPFAGLISKVPESVPRLLINNEVVACREPLPKDAADIERYLHRTSSLFAFDDPENRRDALFKGSCDEGVEQLAEALGWGQELEEMFEAPIPRREEPEAPPKNDEKESEKPPKKDEEDSPKKDEKEPEKPPKEDEKDSKKPDDK